jgi:hypothetical protein
MGGVEILVIFAVVMGITFALWWVTNAGQNSECDAETESSEDSSPNCDQGEDPQFSQGVVWRWMDKVHRDSRTTHASRPPDYEALFVLPGIYYGLAMLCGVVLIGFTIANSEKLSSTEIGGLIGYTVGAVLSMFAVGRVIELLQQIRDAVRNIPALSPGRSDDE